MKKRERKAYEDPIANQHKFVDLKTNTPKLRKIERD